MKTDIAEIRESFKNTLEEFLGPLKLSIWMKNLRLKSNKWFPKQLMFIEKMDG